MTTNITLSVRPEGPISDLLYLIGQPARVRILLVIGAQEACVCHLEAVLGMRQASISQHLMVLRKAGLVSAQREGRNIFYRLNEPAILQVLQQAALISGLSATALEGFAVRPAPGCPCPQCNPGLDPDLTCGKLSSTLKQ
jgi:ArsR family transcriptional regulator